MNQFGKASLLTINTVVPTTERDGSPIIVFYDNGDWEIALLGDADYIEESSNSFVGYETFVDFFVGLMILYDMGDVNDLDVSDDIVYLMISQTVYIGRYDEPVLMIFQDGSSDVMEREQAEKIIQTDPEAGFNFIPALDIFEDFRTFRARHEDVMFSYGDESTDVDEDADPEDL